MFCKIHRFRYRWKGIEKRSTLLGAMILSRIFKHRILSDAFLYYPLLVSKKYLIFATTSIWNRRRGSPTKPLAFFMPIGWCYISSVPCGALMRPLPVSGGSQRGAELFLFPLRLSINILFHLNDFQNEKNNCIACTAGKGRAKDIGSWKLPHSIFRAGARSKAHSPWDVAKRFFFRPISCFSRKEPPSLQCCTFWQGDDVRQLCRWHFLCLSVDII